jgi:hypothetical protein
MEVAQHARMANQLPSRLQGRVTRLHDVKAQPAEDGEVLELPSVRISQRLSSIGYSMPPSRAFQSFQLAISWHIDCLK